MFLHVSYIDGVTWVATSLKGGWQIFTWAMWQTSFKSIHNHTETEGIKDMTVSFWNPATKWLILALVAALTVMLAANPVWGQNDSTIEYAENGTDPVATFTADDPEGATSITWSLAADATIDGVETEDITDAGDFAIDDETGELTFAIGGTAGASPDYENPAGGAAGDSNTYKVVVLAADAATGGQTGYYKVTVNVTNVDEPGTVTLATSTTNGTPQYLVGATLTATAEDGDITNATQTFTADVTGEVTGVVWRWYSGGTMITGADAQDNTYTLQESDAGKHIRAVVYYVVTGNIDQDTAEEDHRISRAQGSGRGQPARVRPGNGLQDHQRGGEGQERRSPGDGHK